MPDLRRSPLYEAHVAAKGRMVEFAGWAMPVQYSGILEECRAVRSRTGLFDISHMGRVRLKGSEAEALLDRLTTNDVRGLNPGHAHYSLLTNPSGGIIDDVIIYRVSPDEFSVVINASNTLKDLDWICRHAEAGVEVEEYTERTAMLAIQGPEAPALINRLSNMNLDSVDRFAYADCMIAGVPAAACRTGYTGEDGFELVVPADTAIQVWDAVIRAGAVPCGLGARDALRIEAGYPLYGHEINDATTPVEAGLMWVVRLDKGDFIGRDSIAKTKEQGASKRLVGILLNERIVPRQGYTLIVGERVIGSVTSGVFSPTTERGLGMAYIEREYGRTGTAVEVQIRANRFPAIVVPKKDLLKH